MFLTENTVCFCRIYLQIFKNWFLIFFIQIAFSIKSISKLAVRKLKHIYSRDRFRELINLKTQLDMYVIKGKPLAGFIFYVKLTWTRSKNFKYYRNSLTRQVASQPIVGGTLSFQYCVGFLLILQTSDSICDKISRCYFQILYNFKEN